MHKMKLECACNCQMIRVIVGSRDALRLGARCEWYSS